MGNEQGRPLKQSQKRKNHSFDAGEFQNFSMDKVLPINVNQSHISSSLDIKGSSSLQQMPAISKRTSLYSSLKPKLSIKQQNAKLQKLTKTNDELRKQLMEINKKLSEQLQRKKMPTLMTSHGQKAGEKERVKSVVLKKQLENAYSQVNMYKRQIEGMKKNDSHQNDIKLQGFEDKVSAIDQQISQVQKSIDSMKGIVGKQQVDIARCEEELAGEDVEQNKRQIAMLKERLKKIKEVGRKKEREEKMRHELLIQMERKLREVNQEYVPELRNWAEQEATSKSRIANIKPQQKKHHQQSHSKHQQKQFRYLPSKLQLEQVQTELKKQKQAHEQFHRRIDFQLKKRNDLRDQKAQIQQKLQTIYKTLQNLHYKKERYMQLIMGGVLVGGEGMEEMLSVGEEENLTDGETIVKGENLQGQVEFSDRKIMKNYQQVVDRLRIVTLHVWVNDKGHINCFQFYYTDGDSFFVGGKSAQPYANSQKHTLQLAEGDYVRNVMGIFNSKTKFLEFVVFESLKGKVLKVGKESFKNTNFNLRIAKGQRPAVISGACVNDGYSWRINRLDFLVKSG